MDCDEFGANAILVRSIPRIIATLDVPTVIHDLLNREDETSKETTLETQLRSIISRRACRSSIKANQIQTPTEVNALLRQLDACPNATNCPHGRPIYIRWDQGEIERLFKRKP